MSPALTGTEHRRVGVTVKKESVRLDPCNHVSGRLLSLKNIIYLYPFNWQLTSLGYHVHHQLLLLTYTSKPLTFMSESIYNSCYNSFSVQHPSRTLHFSNRHFLVQHAFRTPPFSNRTLLVQHPTRTAPYSYNTLFVQHPSRSTRFYNSNLLEQQPPRTAHFSYSTLLEQHNSGMVLF